MNVPLRVGLTGGVASGKTTVGESFARRGVPTFSADRIAHDLTRHGGPALAEIRAEFGDGVFASDGSLDRTALAERIFTDAAARGRLERILHPPIVEALASLTAASAAPYCVVEIPLLEPHHIGPLVDRVLVVDVSPDTQIDRLQALRGLTRDAAERRLGAQKPREARLAMADDVIRNDGLPADLEPQVDALHALYIDLARRGEWAP
jgi:dephospho-CoA kinase